MDTSIISASPDNKITIISQTGLVHCSNVQAKYMYGGAFNNVSPHLQFRYRFSTNMRAKANISGFKITHNSKQYFAFSPAKEFLVVFHEAVRLPPSAYFLISAQCSCWETVLLVLELTTFLFWEHFMKILSNLLFWDTEPLLQFQEFVIRKGRNGTIGSKALCHCSV